MNINNKFNNTNLGSIARVQTGPFGSQLHEKDYVEEGTPIITVEHLGYGSIIGDNIPCVSESDTLRLKKFLLKAGDIVFSRVGSVDRSVLIREGEDGWMFSGRCLRVRVTTNDILPAYLYYYFTQNSFRQYVRNNAVGATMPSLNSSILRRLKIIYPSISKQKQITEILNTIDNSLSINRRRIRLLEEAARLLFREWFVYFRFPGHEKVKIVDGVPEGWSKKKLVEIANITMGQSPKSENYNDEGVGLPFHQGVTGFGDRFPTTQTYCTQKNRIALYGDILFSVRAPVGRLNVSIEEIIIGRGLSAIRSKENHQSFLFYKLKNHFFKEDMIGGGAIFAAITKSDLENVSIIYPDEKIIENFENISKPIDKQIENLSIQNQKLAQARDLLLPRLMSGRIEV